MPKNKIQIWQFELFSNNMRRSLALHVHPHLRKYALQIYAYIASSKLIKGFSRLWSTDRCSLFSRFQFYFAKNKMHLQVLCCTGWLFECFSIWPMGTKILSSPLRLPLYVANGGLRISKRPLTRQQSGQGVWPKCNSSYSKMWLGYRSPKPSPSIHSDGLNWIW